MKPQELPLWAQVSPPAPGAWKRPLGVWLLSLLILPLLAGAFLGLGGWSMNQLTDRLWLFGTLGQALMDLTALGLVAVWRAPATSSRAAHLQSLAWGLAVAALLALLRVAFVGHLMAGRFMGGVPAFTQAWDLAPPVNLFAAPLALMAYGPGEALLVLTWMRAWDGVWKSAGGLLSPGVGMAALLWAFPHLLNVPLQGLEALTNTLVMLAVGVVFGALARGTRSPWGPLAFWTLANGTSL